jgi:hypothetical protein
MDENSHGVGRWKKSLTLEKYNTSTAHTSTRATSINPAQNNIKFAIDKSGLNLETA